MVVEKGEDTVVPRAPSAMTISTDWRNQSFYAHHLTGHPAFRTTDSLNIPKRPNDSDHLNCQ